MSLDAIPPLARGGLGLLVALAIAFAARRAGSLSRSGAAAATLLGTLAVLAGWSWGALLVIYFAASSALSHWREGVKRARTGSVVAKGGARDAWQVLANGAVFALAALGSIAVGGPAWPLMAGGALAASTADTWATEIGTLAGAPPRHILTLAPVPPGTSGAISAPGTAASLAGALFIAALAALLGWRGVLLAVATGGIAGSLLDSLLGATLQIRRWCGHCNAATERTVHACGHPTRPAGGLPWMDNDAVNLACTVAGALIAVLAG